MPPSDLQPGVPIVITATGMATSLGLDAASTLAAIRSGRIGLGAMPAMESPLPDGSLGGQALDLPADFASGLPREIRALRWVITQALTAAFPHGNPYAPRRCALILGTTLHGIRAGGRFLRTDNPRELIYFLASSVARKASEGLGLEGACMTTCSACSSSLGAIALGATLLESGQFDLVIAGGYDAVSEYAWAGFNALRLVAPDAVRPFATNRKGMMLAEGYAVVALERAADAAARGRVPIAHLAGWGESADAHHLTQPEPNGSGAARAMHDALRRARTSPAAISMIAAHATSDARQRRRGVRGVFQRLSITPLHHPRHRLQKLPGPHAWGRRCRGTPPLRRNAAVRLDPTDCQCCRGRCPVPRTLCRTTHGP
jgi:3-oxoacyl-[acyl-carrier-protein] synthase II